MCQNLLSYVLSLIIHFILTVMFWSTTDSNSSNEFSVFSLLTYLFSFQNGFVLFAKPFPNPYISFFFRPGLMWLRLLKWFEDIVLLTQPPHHVIVLSTDLSSGVVVSVGEWMLCFVMGRGQAAETSLLRINGLFWPADTILQSAESVCLVKIKGSLENHIVCLWHKTELSLTGPHLSNECRKPAPIQVSKSCHARVCVWFM